MPTNLMEKLLETMERTGLKNPTVSIYKVRCTDRPDEYGVSLFSEGRFVQLEEAESLTTCIQLTIQKLTR